MALRPPTWHSRPSQQGRNATNRNGQPRDFSGARGEHHSLIVYLWPFQILSAMSRCVPLYRYTLLQERHAINAATLPIETAANDAQSSTSLMLHACTIAHNTSYVKAQSMWLFRRTIQSFSLFRPRPIRVCVIFDSYPCGYLRSHPCVSGPSRPVLCGVSQSDSGDSSCRASAGDRSSGGRARGRCSC